MSSNLFAHLKSLRYYDKLILKGKRVEQKENMIKCSLSGHEPLLGFLNLYVDDPTVRENCYRWDPISEKQLSHVLNCKVCMSKIFSIPDPNLRTKVSTLLRSHL